MANDSAEPNVSKKGCTKVIFLVVAGVLFSVYALQFLLDFVFRIIGPDNDITSALAPFQNHYLSLSPYFITTEGMSGEFTNDVTGAGRFFGSMIVPIIAFAVGSAILYFIKPLRKYYGTVLMFGFFTMVAIVFFNALFVPPKKAIFDPSKSELTLIKKESLIKSKSVVLKFAAVEKVEYDFLRDYDGYTVQTIVYCQLFAIIDGKRVLLGENEVDSFGGKQEWTPSEGQKATAQKGLDAVNKLLLP